ncbi:MAG: HlyD family efflux transporter periplasmic adaptor subunit [Acidobacteria bacterium]|nr:HlyD family efflux transporter periplasmic adaptor subunit [Acidobacteriota bacterium]
MTRDAETINYPKLRKDLIFSRQQMAGETIVVVKDQARGTYYRLREVEWFVTEQFDGETSLETVQRRAEENFGATLPIETLRGFVLTLSKTGFLESGKQDERSSRSRGKQWIRGSLLYLRFQAFDPDRLFTRLAQKVWFFNTPHFVIFSAALILAAMGVTITHWSEISQDVDRLYQVSAIPLIILTVFVVVAAHEFAHGLTCKHFGGEVHEVGFMLIYFQPAFYCNVSDAWLFPEKSRRLWVGFAGPFFELFLWAIATFLWLITDVDTLINFISLIVMASSGIKTLLNFNPLIKLDGYYLLADYLEMPNLRRRAFRYIGEGIKRLSGMAVEEIESPTARERRIYIIYGLIATVASFSLLALVFVQAGTVLIENNQPILLALLIGFLGLRVRRRLRRLFSRSRDPDDEEEIASPDSGASDAISDVASEKNKKMEKQYPAEPAENKTIEKHSPDELAETSAPVKRSQDELAETSALVKRSQDELAGKNEKLVRRSSQEPDRSRKSRRRSWKRLIRGVVILGAIPAILYFGKMEHRVAGQFYVLPVRSADVRVEIEGIIEMIAVKEGDQVREGDLIARLSDRDLRPELAKTEAHIQQMQAKLKMLEAGPTAMEIEVAKSAVARTEESLKYARGHASRNQQLFNDQLISRKDFETTQELAALAEKQLVEANNKLNVVLQGTRPEEIAATKSEIEGLETQRRHLEDQLGRLNIHSVTSGIIATPARQLKELRLQLVKKGDLILKIYDPKAMTAEIMISEKMITDVKVGQKVSLKALTYPDLTFEGTVMAIGVAAQGGGQSSSSSSSSGAASLTRNGSTSKTILVTTQLDNSSLLLKPEMTGHAKIYCGQRRLIELLRWRLARVIKVEFWSWW